MSLIFKESYHKQDFISSKEISEAIKDKVMNNLKKIPMTFITNTGQIDSEVKYYAKGRNFGFYFSKDEVVLSFIKGAPEEIINKNSIKDHICKDEEKGVGVALALHFIDANSNTKIEGQVKGTGRINYLKGNDPEKWYTDLSTYEKVVYKGLWKGIDLVFYGTKDRLKYEFVVHPGADFKDIKLSYKGVDGISLDEEGNLLIKNEIGVLIDERPVSYQEIDGKRVTIDSRFEVKNDKNMGNLYSFAIEKDYNQNYPIIIDPGLIYSTFLGGSSFDEARDIAIDNSGSAYVTGRTTSANFPTTAGAFQTTLSGLSDAFVTKLNADGSGLIYSTYLGGSASDAGNGISLDNTGSAYVIGQTTSLDFPITVGAFQPVYGGGVTDSFVTKLNPSGSGLTYSTYLGGNGDDEGNAIAVDSTGSAYVTGDTTSTNFPTSAGAFQTTLSGIRDVFVTKLNTTGTGLIYSTYLGGGSFDEGEDIAVDNNGSAYITGDTSSGDFPVTPGAFQTILSGFQDAFITKLNTTGTGLIYSTFLGGSSSDGSTGIAVDNSGSAYLTGFTTSVDFPTTAGAFQTTFNGNVDVFISKLNPAGSGLIFSTYLGGSNFDESTSIALDNTGSAYVTGDTSSGDFPITPGAFQSEISGPPDSFVTRINATGTGLIYSTYLGGSSFDIGNGIAIDNKGSAYVTGVTQSLDFPTTAGAFQPGFGGGTFDAFVSKINTNTVSPKVRIANQNITAIVFETG